MTFDQQEPSANSPCTKTTFLVFGDVWALATRLSSVKAALVAAVPSNVRRFIIVSPLDYVRAISLRNGKYAPRCDLISPPSNRFKKSCYQCGQQSTSNKANNGSN